MQGIAGVAVASLAQEFGCRAEDLLAGIGPLGSARVRFTVTPDGDGGSHLSVEEEPATDESGWSVALDASLSFGESMGFLFDDEMVVDRRPETLRRAPEPAAEGA